MNRQYPLLDQNHYIWIIFSPALQIFQMVRNALLSPTVLLSRQKCVVKWVLSLVVIFATISREEKNLIEHKTRIWVLALFYYTHLTYRGYTDPELKAKIKQPSLTTVPHREHLTCLENNQRQHLQRYQFSIPAWLLKSNGKSCLFY